MHTADQPSEPLTGMKLTFPYKGGVYVFTPEEIIRLEADSNYTYIHLRDRKPILMARVLGSYASLLEPLGFIRIHKSHLVNSSYVTCITGSGEVMMMDESSPAVSRRRRKALLDLFHHHGSAA